MAIPHNIFLVGPMGSGKSTVGRRLSRALGKTFVDCDSEIEQRTGADIPWIFDVEGEEGFRKRESAVLDELSQRSDIVLATGGGAVLWAENRQFLMSRGFVIYLKAPLDLLVERTSRDRNRPLLHSDDPAAALAAIVEERDPIYESVA